MTADQVRAAHERIDLLTEERDELRAEVARLTAELAAARNVAGLARELRDYPYGTFSHEDACTGLLAALAEVPS